MVAHHRARAAVVGVVTVGEVEARRRTDLAGQVADARHRTAGHADSDAEIDVVHHQRVEGALRVDHAPGAALEDDGALGDRSARTAGRDIADLAVHTRAGRWDRQAREADVGQIRQGDIGQRYGQIRQGDIRDGNLRDREVGQDIGHGDVLHGNLRDGKHGSSPLGLGGILSSIAVVDVYCLSKRGSAHPISSVYDRARGRGLISSSLRACGNMPVYVI